jgi:hypothetical protein
MNIYHSTQEWDKLNQSLSDIFEVEYQFMEKPIIDIPKQITEIPWNKGLIGFRTDYKHSEQTKSKMSQSGKGKIRSQSHCDNISKSKKGTQPRLGAILSQDTKDKISNSLKGKPVWNAGKTNIYSEDTLELIREKALNREKITCIHCGKLSDKPNHTRWHGSNCKLKAEGILGDPRPIFTKLLAESK